MLRRSGHGSERRAGVVFRFAVERIRSRADDSIRVRAISSCFSSVRSSAKSIHSHILTSSPSLLISTRTQQVAAILFSKQIRKRWIPSPRTIPTGIISPAPPGPRRIRTTAGRGSGTDPTERST
mmetsp:Transcript_31570/g.64264  ORF Transcript_31570/g.64264 Transcript_31570/m.64264 type:complete len:124 (+) Transcript_31570:157-528(+)